MILMKFRCPLPALAPLLYYHLPGVRRPLQTPAAAGGGAVAVALWSGELVCFAAAASVAVSAAATSGWV